MSKIYTKNDFPTRERFLCYLFGALFRAHKRNMTVKLVTLQRIDFHGVTETRSEHVGKIKWISECSVHVKHGLSIGVIPLVIIESIEI